MQKISAINHLKQILEHNYFILSCSLLIIAVALTVYLRSAIQSQVGNDYISLSDVTDNLNMNNIVGNKSTLATIQRAFDGAGVEFISTDRGKGVILVTRKGPSCLNLRT